MDLTALWKESSMAILEETAQLVKEKLGPDFDAVTIEKIVIGIFFTGVKLSTGTGGICFTPIKNIPQAVCCPSSAGRIFNPTIVGQTRACDVLDALSSSEAIKTATAIATLNALSATCWQRGLQGNYTIQMNRDAQDAVRMGADQSVAVIGAFVPVLKYLKQRGGTWWVIEKDPATLRPEEMAHFVSAERSREIIAKADVLIITGVTLLNHSLEEILQAAGPHAEIAVIGPTASLLPEALQTFAAWSPFPWMVHFPVELILGRLTPAQTVHGFTMQALWITVGFLVMQLAWGRATSRYSAVGA